MAAESTHPTPAQRARLELAAARLMLPEYYRPEIVVSVAADLVAEGLSSDGLIGLAGLPSDVRLIDGDEVQKLLLDSFAELDIATSMIDRTISPTVGANLLWQLYDVCGGPAVLSGMLQLLDAWESSVGAARAAFPEKMRAAAPEVIAAADQYLAGTRGA
jgi:hypothetical protein